MLLPCVCVCVHTHEFKKMQFKNCIKTHDVLPQAWFYKNQLGLRVVHAQPPHFRVTSKRRDSTIAQHFAIHPRVTLPIHSRANQTLTDTQRVQHFSRLPSPLHGSLKEFLMFSLSCGCGACVVYGSLLVLPHQIPTVAKVGYHHLYPHFREGK